MALTKITQGVIEPNENFDTNNINSTGVVTATSFDGNINSGVVTATELHVGVDTGFFNEDLVVNGDARITGIFTVGRDTLIFDGLNNQITVGSGVTIDGSSGIITATRFVGDGSNLSGIDATSLKDSEGNIVAQAVGSGLVITGIITASSFAGDASSLTGVSDLNSRRNVARLAVIQAEDSGSSIVNLDNQVIDSFNDDTGIDAVNSSDYFRNTTNKYVVGNIDKLTGTASTDKTTVTIGSTSYNFYQVQSGIATLTVSSAPVTFDILVIGGGGGGGSSYGGGGGAGLVVWGRDIELPAPGTYPMEVGEGGLVAPNRGSAPTSDYIWGGTPGYATTFAGGTGYALTATGGGGGAGIRWAPHCTNNAQGYPGANGGGGGSKHPSCPTVPYVGGTGSKPPDISADPTNIWGSTSTVTYYGGNAGGGGSYPWGEGGGGGGAGGAGTAGDSSGPTYSDGGVGVQITSMAPDGQTYYWAGGGGGAGSGAFYASQTTGAAGGLGGGGGGSNYNLPADQFGANGGGTFNSVAQSPLGEVKGAGIKNSGGGGGGGGSPKSSSYGDMNGGSGYILLRSTTANAGITTDMALVGVTTTATSVPTKSSLIITITEVTGTTTLNTDIKGYVSRDGGATYTQGTLQSFGATLPSNQVMLGFENLDISSQPSGSSMKYKITTHNQVFGSRSTAIKNVSLSWS